MLNTLPPPVPKSAQAATSVEPTAAADHERWLTAELSAVLGNRAALDAMPRSTLSAPVTQDSLAAVMTDDGIHDFEWLEPNQTSKRTRSSETTPKAETWVRRARRQRQLKRLRNGVAWIVTMVIGGAVLAAATYLMLGHMPTFAILEILRDELFL